MSKSVPPAGVAPAFAFAFYESDLAKMIRLKKLNLTHNVVPPQLK